MNKSIRNIKPKYWYLTVISVVLILALTYLYTGNAYTTQRNANENAERENLAWSAPPEEMQPSWTIEGVKSLVNTPGSAIAIFDNEARGLNSEDGTEKWSYKTKMTICDATNYNGSLVLLMKKDNNCTSLVKINAATGQIMTTAEYATNSMDSRLRASSKNLAIVSANHVRIVRDDFVTVTEFGDQLYPFYEDDQNYENCTISDVVLNSTNYAVAAKCYNKSKEEQEANFNIKVGSFETDESTKYVETLNIDTGSADPVTLPIITPAMIQFVVSDHSPTQYTFDLTKSKTILHREPVMPGQYGYPYQDFPGIGYVWRVGNTLNLRYGSQDLTNPIQIDGVIGNVMDANDSLLVPTLDAIRVWNPTLNIDKVIKVEGLQGREFAFSGKTIMALNEGTITAYS